MEVEKWRSRELTDDVIRQVKEMLFELPRSTWPLAREYPPLSLVKFNVDGERYGAILDYGTAPDGQKILISAVLDKDGQMLTDQRGELQVAICAPQAMTVLAACGQITPTWMNHHFCDA